VACVSRRLQKSLAFPAARGATLVLQKRDYLKRISSRILRINYNYFKVLDGYAGHDGLSSLGAKLSSRRTIMPLIGVHLIENVLNAAQKRQIVQKLTDAMVSKVRTCAA
jgi:hypothetical protein